MDNKNKKILQEKIEKLIYEEIKNGNINEGLLDRLKAKYGGYKAERPLRKQKKTIRKKLNKLEDYGEESEEYRQLKAQLSQTPNPAVAKLGGALVGFVNKHKRRVESVINAFEKEFNELYKKYSKHAEHSKEMQNFDSKVKQNEGLMKLVVKNFNDVLGQLETYSKYGTKTSPEEEEINKELEDAGYTSDAIDAINKRYKDPIKRMKQKKIMIGSQDLSGEISEADTGELKKTLRMATMKGVRPEDRLKKRQRMKAIEKPNPELKKRQVMSPIK